MLDNAAAPVAVVICLAVDVVAALVADSVVVSAVVHTTALASSRMSRSRTATLRCTLADRAALVLEAMAAAAVLVAGREELVVALEPMVAVLPLVAGKEELVVSAADAALAAMAVVQELAAGKAVLVADAVLAAMAVVPEAMAVVPAAGRELVLVLVLAPMPGDHRPSSTIP